MSLEFIHIYCMFVNHTVKICEYTIDLLYMYTGILLQVIEIEC